MRITITPGSIDVQDVESTELAERLVRLALERVVPVYTKRVVLTQPHISQQLEPPGHYELERLVNTTAATTQSRPRLPHTGKPMLALCDARGKANER